MYFLPGLTNMILFVPVSYFIASRNALIGGVLLALIEGMGVALTNLTAPPMEDYGGGFIDIEEEGECAPPEVEKPDTFDNKKFKFIKSFFPKLKIVARGSTLKAIGDPTELDRFEKKMELIF